MAIAEFVNQNLLNDAVYWSIGAGEDDGEGNITYPAPIEIKCRWQDVNEMVDDNEGNQFLSQAIIYSDRELEDNGWLFEGKLTDIVGSTDNPKEVAGAYMIKKKGKSSRLKIADEKIFKVWI